MAELNRRQLLAAALGAAGTLAVGSGVTRELWPLLGREDLVPGRTPQVALQEGAWTRAADRLTFAAVGDTGSGGRQAMAVANRMAEGYRDAPYGLVTHLGDLCYYGSVEDRFDDVFTRPMRPLIDAGVRFELAIGNHDGELHHSDESLAEIDAELRLLGTPARHYTSSHGPVDFFYLDSSTPGLFGDDSSEQLEWLDDALVSSQNQWKVVCMHHPVYSSGAHGSTPGADEVLEPLLARRKVDLVLSGHDHHYERTRPQDGVTYVVSGGGCKTTPVGRSRFTASAASALQYLHVDVVGDRMTGRSVRADGRVLDRFELRAREGR
ncbi:3',5'-cyclic AMP phosphodiesterase CpdA [Blastococcus aggregatus]|uniref:3',5'-cyclic AMP phosphodiesterase CpdA n=1 Tax=Blastococcus aggregatus TaxID=38502 RepID=A0A285VC22_9ACTN|nr:metallophosphoesterase [Blastococcus aggregatus]SOC50051.1 3',5'-cyclic AMP phosphodiesterase CpdA [Blastococcus aggregatus]